MRMRTRKQTATLATFTMDIIENLILNVNNVSDDFRFEVSVALSRQSSIPSGNAETCMSTTEKRLSSRIPLPWSGCFMP